MQIFLCLIKSIVNQMKYLCEDGLCLSCRCDFSLGFCCYSSGPFIYCFTKFGFVWRGLLPRCGPLSLSDCLTINYTEQLII